MQLQHSDPTHFYFLVKWVGERVVWSRQCGRQRGDDVGAPSNLRLQQPGVARPTAVALSNTRPAAAHDMLTLCLGPTLLLTGMGTAMRSIYPGSSWHTS